MSREAKLPWEVEAYDGRVWRGWKYRTQREAELAYLAAIDGTHDWVHVRIIHRTLEPEGSPILVASRCVREWHSGNVICPYCGKENKFDQRDSHIDGLSEYHSECRPLHYGG